MGFEIIKPGDKIDINLLYQNTEKVYKSSFYNYLGKNFIEIMIPTDNGKIAVFNLGTECQLKFNTTRGMFTCEARVEKRYRKENFFMMLMSVTSELKKYQRREFFRAECLVDFSYYKLTDEIAEMDSVYEMFDVLVTSEYIEKKKLARTRDLSGGGACFTAVEPLEIESKILAVLPLQNDKVDYTFYLVGNVISCEVSKQKEDRWIVRAQWKFEDIKERDLLVRYVFEEDRKKRKKEIR